MSTQKLSKDEYLKKDFDYHKLTKQELRQIMSENNVSEIPPIAALKSVILEAYKKEIHDRIDSLKSKFDSSNIFQTRKTSKKNLNDKNSQEKDEVSLSKIGEAGKIFAQKYFNENSLLDQSNYSQNIKANESNISLKSEHIGGSSLFIKSKKANDSNVGPGNKSVEQETNTSRISKERIPIIPVLKRGPIFSSGTVNRRGFRWSKYFFWLLILALTIYFKFYCPYCSSQKGVCIPIPPNARLIDNQLVCDDGYKIVKGIVNICVTDNRIEKEKNRKVLSIIKMLEYLKGDFIYGFVKSSKIKLDLLTSEQDIINRLTKSNKVIVKDGLIEAKDYHLSFRGFLKFYSLQLAKIVVVVFILYLLISYWISKRRKANVLKQQAFSISKEVLDVLNRQLTVHLRSSDYRAFVTEEQIKDALEIKNEVWPYVRSIVERNSNVESGMDERGIPFLKWIGPVLRVLESIE